MFRQKLFCYHLTIVKELLISKKILEICRLNISKIISINNLLKIFIFLYFFLKKNSSCISKNNSYHTVITDYYKAMHDYKYL